MYSKLKLLALEERIVTDAAGASALVDAIANFNPAAPGTPEHNINFSADSPYTDGTSPYVSPLPGKHLSIQFNLGTAMDPTTRQVTNIIADSSSAAGRAAWEAYAPGTLLLFDDVINIMKTFVYESTPVQLNFNFTFYGPADSIFATQEFTNYAAIDTTTNSFMGISAVPQWQSVFETARTAAGWNAFETQNNFSLPSYQDVVNAVKQVALDSGQNSYASALPTTPPSFITASIPAGYSLGASNEMMLETAQAKALAASIVANGGIAPAWAPSADTIDGSFFLNITRSVANAPLTDITTIKNIEQHILHVMGHLMGAETQRPAFDAAVDLFSSATPPSPDAYLVPVTVMDVFTFPSSNVSPPFTSATIPTNAAEFATFARSGEGSSEHPNNTPSVFVYGPSPNDRALFELPRSFLNTDADKRGKFSGPSAHL